MIRFRELGAEPQEVEPAELNINAWPMKERSKRHVSEVFDHRSLLHVVGHGNVCVQFRGKRQDNTQRLDIVGFACSRACVCARLQP